MGLKGAYLCMPDRAAIATYVVHALARMLQITAHSSLRCAFQIGYWITMHTVTCRDLRLSMCGLCSQGQDKSLTLVCTGMCSPSGHWACTKSAC